MGGLTGGGARGNDSVHKDSSTNQGMRGEYVIVISGRAMKAGSPYVLFLVRIKNTTSGTSASSLSRSFDISIWKLFSCTSISYIMKNVLSNF